MAGIIDGEGNTGIYKIGRKIEINKKKRKTPQYRISLTIANTNYSLMLYLKELLGKFGTVNMYRRKGKGNANDSFRIECNEAMTVKILSEIRDCLIVKKEIADLVLEFQKQKLNFSGKKVPVAETERREQAYQESRLLNHRGR